MSAYRQGRPPPNVCPRCLEALLGIAARPDMRYCEKCGGIFAGIAESTRILERLDRELLEIGFQAAAGRVKPRDGGHPLPCPDCQIDMLKQRIESAACEIDACPVHGTWFDTGELVDVIRALNHARKKGAHFGASKPSTNIPLDTYADTPNSDFRAEMRGWFIPPPR